MLTQNKRGRGRAVRYTLTVPLIAALVAAFSVPAYTDERKQVGNKLSYNGNEFVMSESKSDTVLMEDVITGEIRTVITTADPRPLLANGEKIYESGEVVRGAEYDGPETDITTEFFSRVSGTLGRLPDGLYEFRVIDAVVSKKGQLIYHSSAGVGPCWGCRPLAGEPAPKYPGTGEAPMIPADVQREIEAELSQEISRGFRFKPAELDSKPVNAYLMSGLSSTSKKYLIVVQGGKARLRTH